MAIFRPKPWVNPFGNMSILRLFKLLYSIAQKGVFFSRISLRIFSSPILPKKKVRKCPFLDQNHGLTLLEKCQFFDCFKFFFYSLERRFFVLKYRKGYFPGLYCLKKKLQKHGHFWTKPWLNPFGKMSVFRLFEILVFIAQKGVFSLQNIVKDIFLPYIA